MAKPPMDILAALNEGLCLRKAAIEQVDKTYAMNLLNEALDAWNRRRELAVEYREQS